MYYSFSCAASGVAVGVYKSAPVGALGYYIVQAGVDGADVAVP